MFAYTHTHTHTHTHKNTNTRTFNDNYFPNDDKNDNTHNYTHTHTLSLSLSHTHTHSQVHEDVCSGHHYHCSRAGVYVCTSVSMCKDSYTYMHAYIRVDYMCSFIHLYEYKDV